MAGNKYNPEYPVYRPESYKLIWKNEYGDKTVLTGNPKQIIDTILNHYLYITGA